jgi:phosphoglycerate dehydrogenase-like enzyme
VIEPANASAPDRVLLTAADPDAVARATAGVLRARIPWVQPEEPGASDATVWFCAGRPPVQALSLPRLRWIHSGWAGIEDWFERPEWRDGVALTRTVGDFPQRIAEYVAGYLLADVIGARESWRQMEARAWRRWTPGTVAGRSLLVVGHGAIGRRVGEVARALGMATRGIRRGPLTHEDHALGVEDASALEALLPGADVVVNLLPLTRDTESLWNAERFARFRTGAIFINVSRGATVDEGALLAALEAGRPARAILDVFREEPLPAESPLRAAPNVWVTPHVAGIGTVEPLAQDFARNWRRFLAREPLDHEVSRRRGY